jgi:hypothetical protein
VYDKIQSTVAPNCLVQTYGIPRQTKSQAVLTAQTLIIRGTVYEKTMAYLWGTYESVRHELYNNGLSHIQVAVCETHAG